MFEIHPSDLQKAIKFVDTLGRKADKSTISSIKKFLHLAEDCISQSTTHARGEMSTRMRSDVEQVADKPVDFDKLMSGLQTW